MELKAPPKKVVCPYCEGHGYFRYIVFEGGKRYLYNYSSSSGIPEGYKLFRETCKACHGKRKIWENQR